MESGTRVVVVVDDGASSCTYRVLQDKVNLGPDSSFKVGRLEGRLTCRDRDWVLDVRRSTVGCAGWG